VAKTRQTNTARYSELLLRVDRLVGILYRCARFAAWLAHGNLPAGDALHPAQRHGIPLTEKHSLESRGDAYREYQRTTSRFVPWFRKTDEIS
jgi:protein-S-isoprenylcysteine O-methyltransferase Ste14